MGLTIRDLYRFWVDIPGAGLIRMYPQNATLKWVDAKKPGYRFHQRTLEDKLVFIDAPAKGINDFTKLYNLERMGLTCQKVNIFIDEFCPCDNAWETNFYTGYLRLSQGQWNASRCRVTLPVVVEDSYTCVTGKWKKDINLFDYGDPPIDVSPLVGVVQFAECSTNYEHTFNPVPTPKKLRSWLRAQLWTHVQEQCLPDTDPVSVWAYTDHAIRATARIKPGDLFNPDKLVVRYTIKTRFAREFFAGPTAPPGPWYAATGGWQRALTIEEDQVYSDETPEGRSIIEDFFNTDDFRYGYLSRWLLVGLNQDGESIMTNGKELGPILEDWFSGCGLTVVSNFLNINPDGSNPSNKYYDNAAVDAVGLVLFQVTDLARLDETQSATKMETTIKDTVDFLKWLFNLDITIDGTTLRIEHLSYYLRTVTLDLTLPAFVDLLLGAWVYGYDEGSLPLKENFLFSTMTDNVGGDFDGYPIEYDNACVNDREDQPENTFTTSKFLTNIKGIFGNEDFYDSTEILLVSTDGAGVVNFALQPISGKTKINGNLALGYILDRYHDYGRPFKRGLINKVERSLFSTLRQKKQVPFTIPFQCEDYRDNFDSSGLVKTQLGAGEIERASRIVPTNSLTLELKHK